MYKTKVKRGWTGWLSSTYVPSPNATHNHSTYRCYPYLTDEEFAETCHYLDSKYCQATLGSLRKDWRLNVHNALDTSFEAHRSLVTFLQITKPLDRSLADQQLASQIGKLGLDYSPEQGRKRYSTRQRNTTSADQVMIEMEESDMDALPRQSSRPSFQAGYVNYEIHLHPTYRAPCLWFSLHNLPIDESPLDIDTVFRHLVPDQFKQPLRNQGPIGAISIDHHPVTGVPTFFVHPCLLGDAMAGFDCSKEDYLTVWLGLVGGCVGLWVPKEMAMVNQG
ncbi:hypothetical protein F4809DRAFT_651944 [Biscogniauxia mediterranea]|nr:hypothetical protein F4809DRAFT_651944 [Biscogniauxia mediterranea]